MVLSAPLILVVDDDENVLDAVSAALSEAGFRVKTACSAFRGAGEAERLSPDLLILDRRLPDGDGLELCRRLRRSRKFERLPVLFLSSKGTVEERISGLSAGADDYLPKPFNVVELLLRVRALLGRSSPAGPGRRVIRSGEITLDTEARSVSVARAKIKLSPKEFDLLETFLESDGRVLSRHFLLEKVWGYERGMELDTRVVDSTISHLRAKLGSSGRRLVSVLQHGYRLDEPNT